MGIVRWKCQCGWSGLSFELAAGYCCPNCQNNSNLTYKIGDDDKDNQND